MTGGTVRPRDSIYVDRRTKGGCKQKQREEVKDALFGKDASRISFSLDHQALYLKYLTLCPCTVDFLETYHLRSYLVKILVNFALNFYHRCHKSAGVKVALCDRCTFPFSLFFWQLVLVLGMTLKIRSQA